MQNLIVFPGLSSPFHPNYIPIYDLLLHESKNRGINIQILCYPGQQGSDGFMKGTTEPRSSIDYAFDMVNRLENRKQSYKTLGISYGCMISLATSLRIECLDYWKQAIIWGPIPHWDMWRYFGQETRDENLGKGTNIIIPHQEFYRQCIPNEYLIQQVRIPVTVGIGSHDHHVGKNYFDYLKSLCYDIKSDRYFHYLDGCEHNVSRNNPGYEKYINLVFD